MANAITKTNGQQATQGGASSAMVLGSDAYRGALEPTSIEEAYKLATAMASIGYCGVTSAEEALGRIMTGRGLGLSAMQSMRGIYTVHGRPGIDAALMQALCLRSPVCEYFRYVPEESVPGEKATFVTKRAGNPELKHTFTIQQAIQMGLVDRGKDAAAQKDNNYNKNPDAMLRARCRSELARIEYADVVFGMYSREELEAGFGDTPGGAPQRDPNEMAAELLSAEEAAAEAAAGRVTTVQAAKRDYAAEVADLKAKLAAAGASKAARAEVRKAFEAWDGPEPFRGEFTRLYNETSRTAKAPAETAAPPATSAEKPGAVPEGNLFAGADKK